MTGHQTRLAFDGGPERAFLGPRFDGETYEPRLDRARLTSQGRRLFHVMADGRWRTLAELAERVGAPEASVSARLRDLRKRRFGQHQVERRRRTGGGLFEYRLLPREADRG